MPNVYLAAGLRANLVSTSFLLLGSTFAWGQFPFPYGKPPIAENRGSNLNQWEMGRLGRYPSSFPTSPETALAPNSPAIVSVDILRHPASSKARRLLQKALHLAEIGNHRAAIQVLQEALAKEPSAAPYAENILGIEYLKTDQVAKAKDSFEEALRLLPRESGNHSNLGLLLALIGHWDSAEKEVRLALELDRSNLRAHQILALITLGKAELNANRQARSIADDAATAGPEPSVSAGDATAPDRQ